MKDEWVWLFAIALIIALVVSCPIILAGILVAMIVIGGLFLGGLILAAKLWEYGGVGRIAAVGILIFLALLAYNIVQHPEEAWIEELIRYLTTWDWKILLALLGVIAVAVLFGPGIRLELKVLLPRLILEYKYYRAKNKVTQLLVKEITLIVRLNLRPGFEVSRLTIGSDYSDHMWKLILPDGEIQIAVLPGGLDKYPFYKGNYYPGYDWRRGYSLDPHSQSSLYRIVEQIPLLTLIQPRFVVFEVVRDKLARVIQPIPFIPRYAVQDETYWRVIFETKGMDIKALEGFIKRVLLIGIPSSKIE